MAKDRIILKTHGLDNSREVGLVILPEFFYVKVKIQENGEFEVEFFNSSGEQLFYRCHKINVTISRTPTESELKEAGKQAAHYIAESLAQHLLDGTKAAYDTEAHLSEWAAQMTYIFGDYRMVHVPQSEDDKTRGISDTVVVQV